MERVPLLPVGILMSKKVKQVPLPGHEGSGLDEGYLRDKASLDRNLDEQLTGPRRAAPDVSRDDTEMKNPDNDLNNPASASSLARKVAANGRDIDRDVEGRQGSSRPGSPAKGSRR